MSNIIGIKESNEKEFDIDIVSYDNLNTTINTNKKKLYFINLYKGIVAFVFLPVILVFLLFEKKIFLKVFKQVIVILYFIFFLVFIYTLFNQNKNIINNDISVREISVNMNKIKNFNE